MRWTWAKQKYVFLFLFFSNGIHYFIEFFYLSNNIRSRKMASLFAVVRFTQPGLNHSDVGLYFWRSRSVSVASTVILTLSCLGPAARLFSFSERCCFLPVNVWNAGELLLYNWVSRLKCWNNGVMRKKKGKSLLTCEVKQQKHLCRLISDSHGCQ